MGSPKWNRSAEGKAAFNRYNHSAKGLARYRKYNHTAKKHRCDAKYYRSQGVKEAKQWHMLSYRKRDKIREILL